MAHRNPRIQTLFGGPIDIVGDVQGELELLLSLLQQLGYDARTAVHPEGRRLMFVGDLVDRGPDSAGVLERVMGWVAQDRAQCILGNHELDILRGKKRPEENGWFFAEADDTRRETWRAFMDALPAALERADLRVVHACWDEAALEWLAAQSASDGYQTLHELGERRARDLAVSRGLDRAAEEERVPYAAELKCPDSTVPLLSAVGTYNAVLQNGNPVKVLTSGQERLADCPKFIAGAWRMTDQERWWNRYADAVPVAIGHYRRAPAGVESRSRPGEWDYVFDEYAPYAWLGPHRKVFCVDYSGQGYQRLGQPGEVPPRLAALRWPERELVFDDGERVAVPRDGQGG